MYYTNEDFNDPTKTRVGGGGGGSLKDAYVSLKPDLSTGSVHVTVRLIGLPFGFINYQAFTYKGEDKVPKNFPDEGISKKKFNRIGPAPGMVKHFGEDTWKELGFVGSMRWAQNVLMYDENGEPVVKILEKGKSVFDHFNKIEKANQKKNQDKKVTKYVTWLGGPKSHMLDIIAEFNPKMPNNPTITVTMDNEFISITDEEIAALEKVGKPNAQDLEQIYKFNPAFEDTEKYPEWMWFGYPIWRIYKPDKVKTGSESDDAVTPVSEVRMSASSNDDGDPEPVAVAPAKRKPAPVAAEPVATEDAGIFGGGDDEPGW